MTTTTLRPAEQHNPVCHQLTATAVLNEVRLVLWLHRAAVPGHLARAIIDQVIDRIHDIPDADDGQL